MTDSFDQVRSRSCQYWHPICYPVLALESPIVHALGSYVSSSTVASAPLVFMFLSPLIFLDASLFSEMGSTLELFSDASVETKSALLCQI